MRNLATQVSSPFAAGLPTNMPRTELTARLGVAADATLAQLGLVAAVDDETVAVRDLAMLTGIEAMVAAGSTLERLVDTLVEVDRHQHEMPTVRQVRVQHTKLGRYRRNVARTTPLAITVLSRMMQAALDDVAAKIMVAQSLQTREVSGADRS